MARLGAVFCVVSGLACAGSATHAQTPVQTPVQTPGHTLQIVGTARPPYMFDTGGQGSGPAVELVQGLLQTAGLDSTGQPRMLPFQRAVLTLEQGNAIYPALLRTPPRESRYVWIGEVFIDRAVFFTRRNKPAVNSLDSARQLGRVHVMRGSELQAMLQSFGLKDVDTANTETDNARLLNIGRIDGWFSPRAVGRAVWADLGLNPADLRSGESFAMLPFWIAGSPDLDPALVARLRAAYETMKRDGRHDRIVAPLHRLNGRS